MSPSGEGMRVLVTCRQMQNCWSYFEAQFAELGIAVDQPEVVQQPSEAELIEIIGQYDGMIAGDDPLTREVLSHAKKLKILSKWGVGTDGIDKVAAADLGIPVTNTPNVFGDEVADLAMGYVVMLARQLHRIDASVKSGGWWKWEGQSISGLDAGIIGFGSIGQATARRCLGFGMKVHAYDVTPEAEAAAGELGVAYEPLETVFASADYLILCAPLVPATRHIVNAETLALMRPGSRLVNVSRGPLVDEPALIEALRSGHLAAAGLDVFETEPLPADSPLRDFEQNVFGSHNGSNTAEGSLRASYKAVDNLLAGLGLK
ncbi:MAG: phosphoglycerate dehydrogenase [Solirubrobacteraceae bacterium]|nr:phosphoglycerate dehydrogenase [Solirubrobacteraceae bacterium]